MLDAALVATEQADQVETLEHREAQWRARRKGRRFFSPQGPCWPGEFQRTGRFRRASRRRGALRRVRGGDERAAVVRRLGERADQPNVSARTSRHSYNNIIKLCVLHDPDGNRLQPSQSLMGDAVRHHRGGQRGGGTLGRHTRLVHLRRRREALHGGQPAGHRRTTAARSSLPRTRREDARRREARRNRPVRWNSPGQHGPCGEEELLDQCADCARLE